MLFRSVSQSRYSRRKIYRAEKDGVVLVTKGLEEMSELIGAASSNICNAAKTGRKVAGWTITKVLDISELDVMPA